MIKVYQIKDNKAIYPDVSFTYGMSGFQPQDHFDKYVHVADLNVDTLDEAFETGNIGPEDLITRHNQMSSVSVGDILVDDEADTYVVASFGFDKIECDFGYGETN
jgi:hypothetical protein